MPTVSQLIKKPRKSQAKKASAAALKRWINAKDRDYKSYSSWRFLIEQ
jgi:hypothetical protein